jgi:hypothetical protein
VASNVNPSKFDFFVNLIKNAFLGETVNYKNTTYKLSPTLVTPYDFLKKIENPLSQYERLLSELDKDFKATAKTEMYRTDRGWISQGIAKNIIKKIDVDEKTYLIPILSSPSIGIDTSGMNNKSSVILVCCLDNTEGGIVFLEKHLGISKSGRRNEHKWNKLNKSNRAQVIDNLNLLLNISSCGLLAIHTNVLVSPVGSLINAFRDLIDGCFTGYENMPTQPQNVREELRQTFFDMCNNTPIHCDPDFRPLSRDKIVRVLVRTLSKRDERLRPCVPLHVTLESHESRPIQIADIIAGVISLKIRNNNQLTPLSYLYFDNRKINRKARRKGKFAKAYYWFKINS